MTTTRKPERVPASLARKMLLGAQGLLDDPERAGSLAATRKLVRALGFVQVDSINVVQRAQHLTLFARLHRYRPEQLTQLVEGERALFEHWTHDASLIPSVWYPHWKHRFARSRARLAKPSKWLQDALGKHPEQTLAHVLERIETEGPLRSQDFEDERKGVQSGWWNWKPQKAALEMLWRMGELAIARRDGFQKVYDLAERVHPEGHRAPMPARDAHVDWACDEALSRLGIATARELSQFWDSVEAAEASAWCKRELAAGRLELVEVASADGKRLTSAFARPGWKRLARALPDAPSGARLLCPFDPVLRDRARAQRLFDFDYTFEAYTPLPKRKFGYYVLPMLEGDQLVGRADGKLHRDQDTLAFKRVWWEPGVRPTRTRGRDVERAVEKMAEWLGASRVELNLKQGASR
ncbi:MAG: YcaQ family DNA glycosylase [Deltaproteobacteria bacterium]|nr:YcaQ family DNA glycosylase [Deltaproteobacteria bacterium]